MAEVAILGGMLVAGYITVRLAEDDDEDERLRQEARAARRAGYAHVVVRVVQAQGLLDATWSGVQDVRALVEVRDRQTGEVLGKGASGVAHDAGVAPAWGAEARGVVRVAVPPVAPASIRVLISLESQSYVAEHIDLGHAEAAVTGGADEASVPRVLEVDPRGTLAATVAYVMPDPRHLPAAAVASAETYAATAAVLDDEYGGETTGDPNSFEMDDMSGRTPVARAAPVEPVRATRVTATPDLVPARVATAFPPTNPYASNPAGE
mmetsp:Transcript_26871/g.83605  ORF Transcript_26871/g.83605 Transcript_26871/m.83605 type:complete len:265 (-) Transcript_26871:22-816(-)